MSATVTAVYTSIEAMKNAVNDIWGAGIPYENFFVDKSNLEIKVITSTEGKPEILELLNRHTTKKEGT